MLHCIKQIGVSYSDNILTAFITSCNSLAPVAIITGFRLDPTLRNILCQVISPEPILYWDTKLSNSST